MNILSLKSTLQLIVESRNYFLINKVLTNQYETASVEAHSVHYLAFSDALHATHALWQPQRPQSQTSRPHTHSSAVVSHTLSWEDVLVNFSGTLNENVFYVVAFFIFTIGKHTI